MTRITPDTNVLLRALLDDDDEQARLARVALEQAEVIVLTLPTLCELDWVLRKGLRHSREDTVGILRRLVDADKVRCLRWTIEEGLEALAAGADFADGVIAYDGAWQGAAVYVTFDRRAADVMGARGHEVLVPAPA